MNNTGSSSNSNKALSAQALKNQRTLPYARPTKTTNATNASNTARQSPLLQQPIRSLNQQPLIPQASKQAETVPVNDLVQLARSAFSQKDFVAALQFLSRALTVAPKDINLLDSRAASYEKLGQLDKALEDAKAMIRIFPQNPKGYLRAGKTLRLQQNIRAATKLYVAGVERCTKGSKDYETLERMAAEMTVRLEELIKKETRVLDPMDRLPFELIMVIFDSLTFTQRVRCLTISKKWMTYLGSVRHFWYSIDLAKRVPTAVRLPAHAMFMPTQLDEELNNKVTNKTVLQLVKYAPPKALWLGCAQQITSGLLSQLGRAKRAASLESLSLRMNSKIYEQEFSQFWSFTPRLRVLDLHDCFGMMDGAVVSVIERCPNLEELDISECRITEACMMKNCNVPLPNMKKLVIGRWETAFSKEGIDAMVERFPSLITLDIRTMRPKGIEALEGLSKLTQLKHLYTNSIETSNDEAVIWVLQRWVEGIPHLESLQMPACKGVSDATIQLIAAGQGEPGSDRRGWSSSLRMLDLSSSPYLTCQSLSFLATHPLPRLHTLILNRCGRVFEQGLCQAISSCGSELVRVECAGYMSVTDKVFHAIKDHCPKIEMVNLSSCGKVTGLGLKALVNARGQGLERVCVDNCPAVYLDAVEWARTILGDPSRVSYMFSRNHR
ncbi:RNI-like protein [Linnemannia elongata AG-77]|uniref:RNI-like protein n=1 Tax=Linnemannia elongata AG-77 TaxID=1314771 RepID=A0A197K2Z0_9FUNG|nr:RNI-like protein [Linnemannia elongata AG-77]